MRKLFLLVSLSLFLSMAGATDPEDLKQQAAEGAEAQSNSNDQVNADAQNRDPRRDQRRRDQRRREDEEEVLQTCPFATSPDARLVAGRLQAAIQDLRGREACAGEIQGSAGSNFEQDLSALAQMRLDFSCQNLRNVRSDRDFVLAQADRGDFQTSVIPREYQVCINVTQTNNRNTVSLDKACIEEEFQYLSNNYQTNCEAAEAEGQYRLRLNNNAEAIGNVVGSLAGMIENPQCAPGDMLGGIARVGVNALPLLASNIPGYGFGLASIARLATSLLTRLFSGQDPNVEIHEMFEEQYMRCLHMYSTGVALQCDAVQAREAPPQPQRVSTPEDQWAGPIRMLDSQMANESDHDLAAIFVSLDERSINLPDGPRTLREILTDVVAELEQDGLTRLEELKKVQIQSVLDLRVGAELDGAQDQVVPSLLAWLGQRYPDSRGPLTAAMSGRPSGGGRSTPDFSANSSPSLVHVLFSEELLDQSEDTYGINRLNSIRANAHNVSGGDTTENRSTMLINQFNICAYNASLLLTTERSLSNAYSSGGSVATAINYGDTGEGRDSAFARFHAACSEFSCIIDIPRRFESPQSFASWQCNNLNNQARNNAALTCHVQAWANLNDGRSLCETPLSSRSNQPQESNE